MIFRVSKNESFPLSHCKRASLFLHLSFFFFFCLFLVQMTQMRHPASSSSFFFLLSLPHLAPHVRVVNYGWEYSSGGEKKKAWNHPLGTRLTHTRKAGKQRGKTCSFLENLCAQLCWKFIKRMINKSRLPLIVIYCARPRTARAELAATRAYSNETRDDRDEHWALINWRTRRERNFTLGGVFCSKFSDFRLWVNLRARSLGKTAASEPWLYFSHEQLSSTFTL